tara:strand:+ start:397 stop:582 length:186 start_codon:yes stop_codon:yes gene_type:complete
MKLSFAMVEMLNDAEVLDTGKGATETETIKLLNDFKKISNQADRVLEASIEEDKLEGSNDH